LCCPPDCGAAALVISHRTQENYAMSKAVSVDREIEGGSAEPHAIVKYIPQNFANTEDCHLILKQPDYHSVRDYATPPVPHRSYKNFRLVLPALIPYPDTVGRFVHADSSQSKK
jgi:hypothetical protein